MTAPLIGYCRLSPGDRRSGPAEAAAGLAAQRSAIEAWAQARGASITAWYQDLDCSGSTPAAERPGFLAALEAIRSAAGPRRKGDQGARPILVAHRRDRLARGVVTVAVLEALVRDAGGEVATCDASNGDSPEDALMRAILDAFAQFEAAKIRARTRAALAVKRRRGELTGSAPIGRRAASRGHHPDGRPLLVLVPDEHEGAAVRRTLELAATGASLRTIGAALQREGHRSRGASGAWHPGTIARIMRAHGGE